MNEREWTLLSIGIGIAINVLVAIFLLFIVVNGPEASEPTDVGTERTYCRTVVAEQIKEQRAADAQNELVNTAINVLSGAVLGQDFGRSVAYAGRSAAYGAVNRTRMNQYQKRALMQQCTMERKRDR